MATSLKKVLITDPVDSICLKILEENNVKVVYKPKLPVPEILKEIKDADGLIVRSGTTVTADIINASESLKVIGRAGVGVDNVDCDAATRKGVIVMNTPAGNTLSAAEHTCAMIMCLARHIPQACASLKSEAWDRAKYMGSELNGKTLAIIGLGRIGREVAHRMQSFGMKTIGFDPLVPPEVSKTFGVEGLPLDEIWPQANFITLHVPLIPQTKNLINAHVLSKCPKGVRIVNVARGGIIDEPAIFEALNSGQCGGLALDVYIEEPPTDFTLIHHPNVVCTPHLGASTVEAQKKVAEEIAEQFVEYTKGGNLTGVVNAPAINEARKEDRKPWASLANSLGRVAGNILKREPDIGLEVTLYKHGKQLENDSNLLLTETLIGLLHSMNGVNFVNASLFASEKGIKVKVESVPDESLALGLEIKDKGENYKILGTVKDGLPLLHSINSATFSAGVPLLGGILLIKSPHFNLSAIIDAITNQGYNVNFAYHGNNSNGEKYFVIGTEQNVNSANVKVDGADCIASIFF